MRNIEDDMKELSANSAFWSLTSTDKCRLVTMVTLTHTDPFFQGIVDRYPGYKIKTEDWEIDSIEVDSAFARYMGISVEEFRQSRYKFMEENLTDDCYKVFTLKGNQKHAKRLQARYMRRYRANKKAERLEGEKK